MGGRKGEEQSATRSHPAEMAADPQAPRGHDAGVAAYQAIDAIVQKGEELGNGIAAIAMLLKAADARRLEELSEDSQFPLETVGFLVDMMATQVFNVTDELRLAPFRHGGGG